jgi:UDP-glucose 4-epimerase
VILLQPADPAPGAGCTVAVFGVGLIGSAVVSALEAASPMHRRAFPLSWDRESLRARETAEIERGIVAALAGARDGRVGGLRGRLAFVWSAGKADFSAREEETPSELASFRAVLGIAERLASENPELEVVFCLVSSAGGLFEGQRAVRRSSRPSPRRPYGRLKLRQEELLAAGRAPMVKLVYRLASVYGHISPSHRRGLIPTLLLNGIRREVSAITGRMDTLRDFVWVDDVAAFVARALLGADRGRPDETAVLASTRPSSVREIQALVERVLGRRVYVTYSTDASNAEDVTFSSGVVPDGWRITDLESSVRAIYRRAVGGGAAFDRAFGRRSP